MYIQSKALNFEVGHFARHFLFLSFCVAMKGIQFIQLRCHISFLSFTRLTTYFLSSRIRLLNSRKCRLFRLHIQHTTRCLFERRTPVCSSEAAVCGFCLSISLQVALVDKGCTTTIVQTYLVRDWKERSDVTAFDERKVKCQRKTNVILELEGCQLSVEALVVDQLMPRFTVILG